MMKYIVVIGASIMQKSLIENILEMGYDCVCVDQDQNAMSYELPIKKIIHDIADHQGTLLKVIDFFKNIEPPLACLTCGTDFSYTVAVINHHFKLVGVSKESAKKASNKALMRQTFKEFNLQQPSFISIKENDPIPNINFDYPLIVKPTDNMGARGVKIVYNYEQLKSYIHTALSHSKKKEVIVEELIVGEEFSLDALIVNGEIYITGFGDRIIDHEPYRVEIGHHLPSLAHPKKKDKITYLFKQGIKALGITNGFAKGDMFFDKNKNEASIGEIAARLSGGFMSSYTYPLSSGVNLMKNAIFLALGQFNKISILHKLQYHCLERAIIPPQKGILKKIEGVEEALTIPGVLHIFILKKENTIVTPPIDNKGKIGNIIVRNTNFKEAEAIMSKALATIKIHLEPIS